MTHIAVVGPGAMTIVETLDTTGNINVKIVVGRVFLLPDSCNVK